MPAATTSQKKTSLPPPQSNFRVFRPQSTANVVMSFFPLWTHDVPGVSIPLELLFNHVPLDRRLIQRWVESQDTYLGGLLYPRGPFDMESQDPFVQILKSGIVCRRRKVAAIREEISGASLPPALLDDEGARPDEIPRPQLPQGSSHMKVDLTVFVFRRDLESDTGLNPYTPATWHPISYFFWCDMYNNFAPVMQEECSVLRNPKLPLDACSLFRRVMRTHFLDCGILFNRIWWDLGFGAMVSSHVNLRSFMRGMLTDMFMVYHSLPSPPAIRTLFNPRTHDPGQRMCAHCLSLTMGRGCMMRGPCGQVYYCGVECQRAHWKVHRVVCGVKV